jgi:DNA-binding MarR family transcriptional regulator
MTQMNRKQNEDLQEFNRLNQRINECYHKIAIKQGLSDSAFWILFCMLDLGDGCLQKDICSFLCMNKQTVNSSVRNLEKNGFVSLKPGTGRTMQIYLTESGKALMEEKIYPVVRAESEVFDAMPISDRKELLRLTNAYLTQFREKIKEAGIT